MTPCCAQGSARITCCVLYIFIVLGYAPAELTTGRAEPSAQSNGEEAAVGVVEVLILCYYHP